MPQALFRSPQPQEIPVLDTYSQLATRALRGEAPSTDEALWILEGEDVELLPLLQAAFVPRRHHFGRKVMVHVLNNVQNALCPEDCGYCAQNRDSEAAVRPYAMKSDEAIFAEAEKAAELGASRYCMAFSGRGPAIERTKRIAEVIRGLKKRYSMEVCVSAGLMGEEHVEILADAGLDRMNHNLNTSEQHYAKVCSTHTYADRLATLQAARSKGVELCSGMIVGMGESAADIVAVAYKLRELEVPSIPVNFLIPIEGNQVQENGSLTPEYGLRVLCLMRLINPSAEIRCAGGREGNFRSLQPLCLYPANSLFVEGYLTTRGDNTEDTYRMIEDAGFEIEGARPDDGQQPKRGFQIPGGGDQLIKPDIARP
jgi:biotin synthase